MYYGYGFRPYVNQATRKSMAQQYAAKLKKKGHVCCPVQTNGRKIAESFWGKAWCDHMEGFHDFENRLGRGQTYARNGSVFDLQIKPGQVSALVMGSDIYEVEIKLKPLSSARWFGIKRASAGQFASAVELLQGRFSDAVMKILTDRESGMFPAAREFTMNCSCPDGVSMCKHIAAVIYGIGCRLDTKPELFFTLRDVDPTELIVAAGRGLVTGAVAVPAGATIAESDLADVFGVDIVADQPVTPALPPLPAAASGKAAATPKRPIRRYEASASANTKSAAARAMKLPGGQSPAAVRAAADEPPPELRRARVAAGRQTPAVGVRRAAASKPAKETKRKSAAKQKARAMA